MIRVAGAFLALAVLCTACSQKYWGEPPIVPDHAFSRWLHGVESIPYDYREAVANDDVLLDRLRAVLDGRQEWPAGWERGTVVFFLADAGNSADAPRFASRMNHHDTFVSHMAVYGLARTAEEPISEASLIRTLGDPDLRHVAIAMLGYVNSEATRSILAAAAPDAAQEANASRHPRRWPCPEGVPAAARDAFTCPSSALSEVAP